MGVVKNLMVRIGGDASGVAKSMKTAKSATSDAKSSIKKSVEDTKKAIYGSFYTSGKSVKDYSAAIAKTRQDHRNATQGAEMLSVKISKLESVYDTVKDATKGLDMSKPLEELMVDAEKTLTAIESRRKKIEAQLSELTGTPKGSRSKRTAALQAELAQLSEKSRFAQARLAELDRVADAVGASNMGYASAAGLEKLQKEITAAKNELRTLQTVASETDAKLKSMRIGPTLGRMLKSIGTTAASAAAGGVKKLGSAVKNITGSAARGLAALPGKLLNIGKSAASSTGGLNKMVRSIRNIGIVSLGMRVASGMFGRLRSVISSYISENEELNASVTAMKNQLGQALAPAINLVLNLMQKLMPVITAVSNGINSALTAIFGNISATTAAIKSAADAADSLQTYGFDQIAKVSDTNSTGTSSAMQQAQEQSALVKKLTGWIQELKAAFTAGDWAGIGKILGDGINSVFDQLSKIDVGKKIGSFANNVITTLHSLFTTIDFTAIGTNLGASFTGIVQSIDWNTVGETIGAAILALPSMLVGFILETDWAEVGTSVTECVHSAFSSLTTWIQETDWLQIGQSLADLVANIDWGQLATDFFSFLGSALGATVSCLWGFIEDVVAEIGEYFTGKIDECGGNVAQGLLKGIGDGLVGLGTWIYDHIVKPFLDGFSEIQSAATEMITGQPSSGRTTKEMIMETYNKVKSTGRFQFSGDKTPKLAAGGITTGPTMAYIGEAGKEAVLPLENNTGWMDILVDRIKARNDGSTAPTQVVIPVYIGKRKLTEQVISDINDITRTTGACPIHV